MFAAGAFAAPPEDLNLAQIRSKINDTLQRLPDYTCLETIERASSQPRADVLHHVDTARMEVAHVGGRELYAVPGFSGFTDLKPAQIVGQPGLTTIGDFSLHLRTIFGDARTTFVGAGEEEVDGRRSLRYDFSRPRTVGCWLVNTDAISAVAGCRGTVWVDAAAFDLLRFEIRPTEIPSGVPIGQASTRIEYATVRIGETHVQLPRRAVTETAWRRGGRSRNIIEFSHCRQYATNSSISFADPAPSRSSPKPAAATLRLPAGLRIKVALADEVDLAKASAGTLISANVSVDAMDHDTVAVPAGATLNGRIRRLERASTEAPRLLVEIEIFTVEAGGDRLPFYARLESVESLPGLRRSRTPGQEIPGVGTLILGGGQSKLPRGLKMVWRAIELRE